jgi:hypothetical protein
MSVPSGGWAAAAGGAFGIEMVGQRKDGAEGEGFRGRDEVLKDENAN